MSAGHVKGDEGNEGELYSRFSAAATPVSAKSKGSAASAKKTSAPTAGTKRKGKQLGSEMKKKSGRRLDRELPAMGAPLDSISTLRESGRSIPS